MNTEGEKKGRRERQRHVVLNLDLGDLWKVQGNGGVRDDNIKMVDPIQGLDLFDSLGGVISHHGVDLDDDELCAVGGGQGGERSGRFVLRRPVASNNDVVGSGQKLG